MSVLESFLVAPDSSIRDVMACIDRNAKGIALVADAERRLIATITDGDIRRAILAGLDLDLPVQTLLDRPSLRPYPRSITATVGTPDIELVQLMQDYDIRHIPLFDDQGRLVDVALFTDLVKGNDLSLTAVVMAGGLGKRLYPMTEKLPKPMLPVGGRPLLELIVEQLRKAGIRRVNLTTHYKSEVIARHFGDGQDFGVDIRYVKEDQPLGTAGALSLLEPSDEPLLVINGDILTRVDFRAMLSFHQEQRADMTVAVKEQEFRLPYGVIEIDGVEIRGIAEKPVLRHLVNAGIYLLAPAVQRHVPNGQSCDMPDLIARLLGEGRRVVSFPVREYWLDIGQTDDYRKALADVQNGIV